MSPPSDGGGDGGAAQPDGGAARTDGGTARADERGDEGPVRTDGGTAEEAATAGGDDAVGGDTLAVNREGLFAAVPGNSAGVGVALVGAALGLLLLPFGFVVPGLAFIFLEEATLFLLYAMVLLGLNLQFGDTGLINFGPVLFLGLGLYGMALISAEVPDFATGVGLGMFWGLGILVGVVAAIAGGAVLGVSSLRLREDYLAITTLAAAEILFELVRVFQTPFGGERGLVGVPQLVVEVGEKGVLPLAESPGTRDIATVILFAGILLVMYEGFRRLSASPYGRVLRSIQADEDATRGMGKSTFSYKIQAFIYGAIVAGIAGGLMAMFFGSASPGLISIDVTVIIWIGMMIGGAGNHRGAIAGLAIIMSLEVVVRLLNDLVTNQLALMNAIQFNALRLAVVGLLLILVIRYRPEGLFGDPEKLEVFK